MIEKVNQLIIIHLQEETVEEDGKGPLLTDQQITSAIDHLKTKKAGGSEKVPAELGTKELIMICKEIYASGEWPE